jgi:hypothetical protein
VIRTDIYRQAIKRTFANLYGVSPDTVNVNWTTGKSIAVQCAGKTFLNQIRSDPDDDAPEFTCLDEVPVIVNLTDDERECVSLNWIRRYGLSQSLSGRASCLALLYAISPYANILVTYHDSNPSTL